MDIPDAFPTRLYDGDTFAYRGHAFKVTFKPDYDHEPPWEDGDGQGIVEVRYRGGRGDKRPGERLLHVDGYNRWYFDWQGTIAKAKQEGWGLGDEERAMLAAKLGREPTNGEVVAQSVEQNFQWMRRFMRDDWQYVGVLVSMLDEDGEEIMIEDVLWGVEYDSDNMQYAMEIVKDCADNCLSQYEEEQQKAREAEAKEAQRISTLNEAAVRLVHALDDSTVYAEHKRALFDDLSNILGAAGLGPA